MKFNKNKAILGLVIMFLLGFAFWYGGDSPGLEGWTSKKTSKEISLEEEIEKTEEEKNNFDDEIEEKPEEIEEEIKDEEEKPIEEDFEKKEEIEAETYSKEEGMEIDSQSKKDKFETQPVPKGKPIPIEAENSEITKVEKYCTLSVECSSILDNMEWLNLDKVELVPEDGIIYARKKVKFYEGESVFNLLLREMKKSKIHMEFKNTPLYNSSYVEGINNLYEFDCGELSGWMYKVNNWFPNYGSSRYVLEEGDLVEWVYTCDLGKDVKGTSSMGGE